MGKWFQKNFLDYTPGDPDENGNPGYVYTGQTFRAQCDRSAFPILKVALMGASVLSVSLYIFILSVRVPNNSSRLVMLPASLGFLAILAVLWGAVTLLFSQPVVERWRHQIMYRCIRWGGSLWSIALPVAAVFSAVVLIWGGRAFLWVEWALCLGQAMLGAVGFLVLWLWKKIGYEPVPVKHNGKSADEQYDDILEDIKDAFLP